MKQKVVIKVSINHRAPRFCCFCPRGSHSKALRLAAGFRGVQSAAWVGDQDRIEVTGEIDAVNLTKLLRKKVGFAEIVSVGEAKKEGGEKPSENTGTQPVVFPWPRQEIVYVRDAYPEPGWCWPL